MTDRPPGEKPREGSQPSSDAEPSKAQTTDISAQARDLLDFEFVEVLAVPRLSRSCLACS
jgi:hypothetical protein